MSKRAQRIRNQRARERRQQRRQQQQRQEQQRRREHRQRKRNRLEQQRRQQEQRDQRERNQQARRARNLRINPNKVHQNKGGGRRRNNRPNNNNNRNNSNTVKSNRRGNPDGPNTIQPFKNVSKKAWKPEHVRGKVQKNWLARINDKSQYQPKRLKFNRTNTHQRLSKYTDPTTGKFDHAKYVQDIGGEMTQRYVSRGGSSKTPGQVISNKGPSVPIAKKLPNVADIKNLYGGGKYTNPNYQKDLIDKTKNKLDDDIKHDSQQSQKYRNLGLRKILGA